MILSAHCSWDWSSVTVSAEPSDIDFILSWGWCQQCSGATSSDQQLLLPLLTLWSVTLRPWRDTGQQHVILSQLCSYLWSVETICDQTWRVSNSEVKYRPNTQHQQQSWLTCHQLVTSQKIFHQSSQKIFQQLSQKYFINTVWEKPHQKILTTMKSSWILGLMLVAVAASFVNLIWETLDYGFPDDLRRPVSEKVRIDLLNEPEILSFKST